MRVLLTMPRYTSQAFMPAAQAFFHPATPGGPLDVQDGQVHYPRAISPTGSIATGCFNKCWAMALNEYEAGRIDGFAMIHADVGAQVGWLDVLYREMQRVRADVIAANIPIKDSCGLFSTAVEDPTANTGVRRLTTRQCQGMAKTFTDIDVPGLLLNTGLWLCKLGAWAFECCFHVENSIVRNSSGKWEVRTFPEDWHFSRQCRRLGLRLAATSEVWVDHYGEQRWSNQEVWGWDVDRAATAPVSAVPAGWKFPDVAGWLTESEGRKLANLAAGKNVLEIGCYAGLSTICMAQAANLVYAVDTFDGRATPTPRDTMQEFLENLDRYQVADRVLVAQGAADEILPTIEGKQFDLIFIDGAHDVASVKKNIESALPLLGSGGLLVFHDYRVHSGVTDAVDHLLAADAKLEDYSGSLAIVSLEPSAVVA